MPVVPNVNDIVQSALDLQRARIESAAMNIARANVPLPPGETAATTGATPTNPDFAHQLGIETGASTPAATASGVRLALEPGNPAADANGIVRYPDVDLAAEMTTMMSASRAYEATVRSYNIMKTMQTKALDIGK